jgi:immunity protein 50 of polymorphic toxin system
MDARFCFLDVKALPKFKGVELVTEIFGCWPMFHDAEIKWLRLDVADPDGGTGPTLEFMLHCFEMTNKISPSGHYVLEKHTLVHFRFREVGESHLTGFNSQNVIFGLNINEESHPNEEKGLNFKVSIEASYGLSGHFYSPLPEVLSAIPCDQNGNRLANVSN